MKEIIRHIEEQNDNREQWAQTPEELAGMIQEEATELVEAINNFPVMQDAEAQVVSEVADVLYLAFRFCSAMGIDPEQAIKMKLQRNSVKYPDHFSSNGWDAETSRAKSKSLWEHMGGDHSFFQWLVDNT